MATPDLIDWPREDIPDAARVFLRVHVNSLANGQLHPGIFREHVDGMSVDWEKYSTAQEARERAADPSKNGVLTLLVAPVRAIQGLDVSHAPISTNRAHSNVTGFAAVGKTIARGKLFRLFGNWTIPPGS